MPKVSVIVPVYGVEKYIERCARSLFGQTLDDIEYLFIDDCSPDKSIEVLNRVLKEYPHRESQVRIHRMSTNSGQAAVRKWGMLNATGDYVIHCDSDDWVDITMYEKMYNKAVEEDSDVVVCDYVVTDGNQILESVKGCEYIDVNKFIQRMLFQRDSWSLWNKLYRRTVCYKDLVYPQGNMGEDMVLCIQMTLQCKRMAYISESYYNYYCNAFSITNKRDVIRLTRNFEQLKSNTDLLLRILDRIDFPNKKWAINALQYNAKTNLLNLIHRDKKYYNLWMNTYKGANWLLIFNPFMTIEKRLKCFLAILKLYPQKKDRI